MSGRVIVSLAISLTLTLIFESVFFLLARKLGMLQITCGRKRLFFRSVKRNQGWWSVANRRTDAPLSDRNAKNSLFRVIITNRDKKDFKLLLLVNILTNPIVVLSFWLVMIFTDWNTNIAIIPLELFAVLVEGLYYKKYGKGFRHPFLFSLGANAFSFGIGSLISIVL